MEIYWQCIKNGVRSAYGKTVSYLLIVKIYELRKCYNNSFFMLKAFEYNISDHTTNMSINSPYITLHFIIFVIYYVES